MIEISLQRGADTHIYEAQKGEAEEEVSFWKNGAPHWDMI